MGTRLVVVATLQMARQNLDVRSARQGDLSVWYRSPLGPSVFRTHGTG